MWSRCVEANARRAPREGEVQDVEMCGELCVPPVNLKCRSYFRTVPERLGGLFRWYAFCSCAGADCSPASASHNRGLC